MPVCGQQKPVSLSLEATGRQVPEKDLLNRREKLRPKEMMVNKATIDGPRNIIQNKL